jgi:hypothetical protein
MRTIHILATAVTLLAMAALTPTLAAERTYRGGAVYGSADDTFGSGADAYASGDTVTDRSGSYYYGPRDPQGHAVAVTPQTAPLRYYRSQNAPVAEPHYGNPDTW